MNASAVWEGGGGGGGGDQFHEKDGGKSDEARKRAANMLTQIPQPVKQVEPFLVSRIDRLSIWYSRRSILGRLALGSGVVSRFDSYVITRGLSMKLYVASHLICFFFFFLCRFFLSLSLCVVYRLLGMLHQTLPNWWSEREFDRFLPFIISLVERR